MHNAAFAALGLPHVYLRFRVSPEELPAALDEARRLGIGGPEPHGAAQGARPSPARRGDAARPPHRRRQHGEARARRGSLGDNTDAPGLPALARGPRAAARRPRGADRRRRQRARGGREPGRGRLRRRSWWRTARPRAARRWPPGYATTWARAASRRCPLAALRAGAPLRDARLVVNTTSAGLAGRALPVRAAAAPRRCLFVDLVYTRTPFLAAAARAGRPTLDGSGMLLHQGALAFEWWTGRRAPLAVDGGGVAPRRRTPGGAPGGAR